MAPSSMHVTTSPVWCTGMGPGLLGKGCEVEGQLSTEQGSLHTARTQQPNKGCSCQFFYLHVCVFLHIGCIQYKVLAQRWPSPSELSGCAGNRMVCHSFKHRLMEREAGRQQWHAEQRCLRRIFPLWAKLESHIHHKPRKNQLVSEITKLTTDLDGWCSSGDEDCRRMDNALFIFSTVSAPAFGRLYH